MIKNDIVSARRQFDAADSITADFFIFSVTGVCDQLTSKHPFQVIGPHTLVTEKYKNSVEIVKSHKHLFHIHNKDTSYVLLEIFIQFEADSYELLKQRYDEITKCKGSVFYETRCNCYSHDIVHLKEQR